MKLVGTKIEMDFGSGLEVVPVSRLGPVVTFKETIAGYGAVEWTFTLLNVDSPLTSTYLTLQQHVRLTLMWGTPGNVQSTILVDGYTREPRWNYLTRSAEITCQDSSVKYATKRVTLSTPMNPAGSSRAAELESVLASFGITSSVDCPGNIRKPINEAGDKTILDWVALYVAPAGRRAQWRNGTLRIVTTDMGTPSVDLAAHDVRSMTVTPAPTNATNSILFTALLIDDSVTPDGSTTVTEDQDGIYTPKGAVRRQNTDGSVDTITTTTTPQSPITRKVTTTTVSGGKVTQTLVEEWRWMSPYAPRAQQQAEAYSENQPSIVASGIVCYDYGDGDKWHTSDQETFRIWRRTLVEEFYSGSVHTGRRTTIKINWSHAYLAFGRAVNNANLNAGGRPAIGPGGLMWHWYGAVPKPGATITTEVITRPMYLWDFDNGNDRVSAAIETFTSAESGYNYPALVIDDAFVRNAVGDISAIRRTLTFTRNGVLDSAGYAVARDVRRWRPGFPIFSPGGFFEITGNISAPRHDIYQSGETEGEFVIGYLPTTSSSRTGHVVSVSGTGTVDIVNRPVGFESEMVLPAPGNSYLVDTAVPVEDRVGPFTSPVTETVQSTTYVTGNGQYQVPARNDYCETTAEEQTVARDLLRQSLALLTGIEIDPRGDIRAGDTVRLVCESNKLALVRDNEIRIDMRTLSEVVQTLTCMTWPAELD